MTGKTAKQAKSVGAHGGFSSGPAIFPVRLLGPSLSPRDAMRKRSSGSSRPVSIRPSRSCIVFKQLKISSKSFLCPVAPSFYFLEAIRYYQFTRGTSLSGSVNYTGVCVCVCVCENSNFRPKSPFISEVVRDTVTVTMEC